MHIAPVSEANKPISLIWQIQQGAIIRKSYPLQKDAPAQRSHYVSCASVMTGQN